MEIDPIDNIETDYGKSFTFTFSLSGGRSPHYVTLKSQSFTVFSWSTGGNKCTGTNELTCTDVIGDGDVNFGYDGTFTVTAKNKARNDTEKTATKDFNVTVFKEVTAKINPGKQTRSL